MESCRLQGRLNEATWMGVALLNPYKSHCLQLAATVYDNLN